MAVDLRLGTGTFRPPAAGNVPRLILGDDGPPGLLLAGQLRAEWGASSTAVPGSLGAAWGRRALGPGSAVAAPWGRADLGTVHRAVRAPWGASDARVVHVVTAPWQRSTSIYATAESPWQRATPAPRSLRAPWQRASSAHVVLGASWGAAAATQRAVRAVWGRASLLVAPNTRLPEPLPVVPPRRRVRLHFCPPGPDTPLHLVLGIPGPCERPQVTTVIPAGSAYVLTHTVTALRLPDLTPVPLEQISLSADRDAFGWTLSATGPVDVLTLLAPAAGLPARLRITADGLVWEFVIEGLRRNREFGRSTGTVTGRSAGVLLSDPYSPVATYLSTAPMTAQQIIEDALFGTGVGLDWRATDWSVPAGAWAHTGTPLSAVRRVADSIGAVVQSPRVGEAVIVEPRYPVLPWEWASATPDVIVESLDPVETEGYERADRPAYEGVYVSGQAQGVLVLVKRTGTAPALYLPLVTDPLITALDAGRQRGESLLGAVGPQARMTLTMPVLTGPGEAGVVDPGKLVRVDDPAGAWVGLVLSTTVSIGDVEMRQTLTLERHL